MRIWRTAWLLMLAVTLLGERFQIYHGVGIGLVLAQRRRSS